MLNFKSLSSKSLASVFFGYRVLTYASDSVPLVRKSINTVFPTLPSPSTASFFPSKILIIAAMTATKAAIAGIMKPKWHSILQYLLENNRWIKKKHRSLSPMLNLTRLTFSIAVCRTRHNSTKKVSQTSCEKSTYRRGISAAPYVRLGRRTPLARGLNYISRGHRQ